MSIKNSVPVAATFSKDSSFFGKKFRLEYVTDGNGALVRGNDSRWYIDWISGLGANLLGYDDRYANDGFYQYVATMSRHGVSYSLPHQLEYVVAEKLAKMLQMYIPYWKGEKLQVRWALSGSDACNAAIRLAKAIKGHGQVYSYGYHGWSDQFIAQSAPAHGLYDIKPVRTLEWGMFPDQFEEVDTAAVIIEIPPFVERVGYLQELASWCRDHKALFIVDEVVTGLRYGRGGACEMYNLEPDLVCMGKALGNGLPIAAVVGPKEYMNWFNPLERQMADPVFVSSTNVGNTASLAGANFVLDYVRNGRYLEHINLIGNTLKDGLSGAGFVITGNAPRNLIIWENDTHKSFVVNYFIDNGVLLNRPNFANMAHTLAHVEKTVELAHEAMNLWRAMDINEKAYWENLKPLTLFKNR